VRQLQAKQSELLSCYKLVKRH